MKTNKTEKPTHAPGPWMVKQVSTGDCLLIIRAGLSDASPDFNLTEAMNQRGNGYIGKIVLPGRETYYEKLETTQAANARLIAAAPDLLDALKEANEALKASGLGSFGGDIYGRIAAAIAKATEQGGR